MSYYSSVPADARTGPGFVRVGDTRDVEVILFPHNKAYTTVDYRKTIDPAVYYQVPEHGARVIVRETYLMSRSDFPRPYWGDQKIVAVIEELPPPPIQPPFWRRVLLRLKVLKPIPEARMISK